MPQRFSGITRRVDPWLIPAGLLPLLLLFALLKPGWPQTADGQVHLLRTLQVTELLRTAVFYPRWAPDFYLGYGYPFFNFYAPGAHLLAGALSLTGLGAVRGVEAVQVLALMLYALGGYLAARSLYQVGRLAEGAAPAALLSALLYLYAPLRVKELFIQGNLSQLLALALLPWCAWALQRAARRADARWSVLAGVFLAALVYVHHPSAFLAYPFLALYGLALAVIAQSGRGPGAWRQGSAAVVVSFVLGILLSAPFWLPSLAELRFVNITAIESGMFNARLNLVPLADLLSPALTLDDAALNPPFPNSLGTAQIVMAALGVMTAGMLLGKRRPTEGLYSGYNPAAEAVSVLRIGRGRRRQRGQNLRNVRVPFSSSVAACAAWVSALKMRLYRNPADCATVSPAGVVAPRPAWIAERQLGATLLVIFGLLGVCLALMLPAAAVIWEQLPLARFIAFPWRLLGPALLWAALLGGAPLLLAPRRVRIPLLVVLIVLASLSLAPYLFPRPFAPISEPTVADITRYELGGGARATASANEYLPRWVVDPNPPPVLAADYLADRPRDRLDRGLLPPGSQILRDQQGLLEDRFQFDLPTAAPIRVRRFYFPGWRAWVDGHPIMITPDAQYGLIEVAVPAGNHELRLSFGGTPVRTAGGVLALMGLAGGAWGWARGRRVGAAAPTRDQQPVDWWAIAVTSVAIVALAGVKVAVIEPHTRWFRSHSAVDAPAGMQHARHARFVNGIELIGYDLWDPASQQGGTLALRLYWRALQPQTANVHPFVHLDALTGDVTWANQTKAHAGDKPSTAWPVGFYVVDDYRLEIPPDTPPVIGLVRAGLVDDRGEWAPLEDGGDQFALTQVRVRERQPLTPSKLPASTETYRLGDALRLVGHSVAITGTPPALEITAYWQADHAISMDYTVFLHALGKDGVRLAQGDGPPLGGWYPTSAWLPGQVVTDRRRVSLPAGADPREIVIVLGLYNLQDGSRLPVFNQAGSRLPNDQIRLTFDGP